MFNSEMNLRHWIRSSLIDALFRILRLRHDQENLTTVDECIVAIIGVAFSCTVESSAERMTMRKVEAKLVKIKKRFLREVGEINMTDYFLNHEV